MNWLKIRHDRHDKKETTECKTKATAIIVCGICMYFTWVRRNALTMISAWISFHRMKMRNKECWNYHKKVCNDPPLSFGCIRSVSFSFAPLPILKRKIRNKLLYFQIISSHHFIALCDIIRLKITSSFRPSQYVKITVELAIIEEAA